MTTTEKYKDWSVTADRYVVYIDIMGFKNMVATQSVDSIYAMMKDVNKSRDKSAAIGYLVGFETQNLVNSTTYSDSIMLYSRDGSKEALKAISLAAGILTSELFSKKVPHKGAMAFGSMMLDNENSIFFGQPLIDAYLLQEELGFYGIIVHHSAERTIFLEDFIVGCFIQFDCPLKNGIVNHKAIYPALLDYKLKAEFSNEQQTVIDGVNALRFTVSGHLRKYVENTQKYFNCVMEETRKRKVMTDNANLRSESSASDKS
jgi:hypothetical protein